MAWRIDESVIWGEIDNSTKGIVRGRIHFDGIEEPVVLELFGNACADLAGCKLKFTNAQKTIPMRRDGKFSALQRGRIGDLTASRKVRVFDIPVAEAYAMSKRGETPPEHIANCLYLEWFSEANGRVVIESVDFNLEISPPSWQPGPGDEEQRQTEAGAGWAQFLGQLNAAIEEHQHPGKDGEPWDEHDYEQLMKESDARTDKYMELVDKYGDSEEAERKIAEEMGWVEELTEEEAEEETRRIEEMNAACEEAANEPGPEPDPEREGIDWIRTKDGRLCHPLQHRCYEAALRVWRRCNDLGLSHASDDDLGQFIFEFQTTSAKLAGALNSVAEGYGPDDPAFTVAYLKRALDHLHKAQAGLEAVTSKKLMQNPDDPYLPESMVTSARRELFEIREEILRLMERLRSSQ